MTDMAPERLRSNEFWGRRSGSIGRDGLRIFKIKRGGGVSSGNNGPAGHKMRWYFLRALRKANGKHWPKKFMPKGTNTKFVSTAKA